MLTSTISDVEFAPDYPDLVGRRVLVTGVTGAVGMEVARIFADSRARVVLQASEDTLQTRSVIESIGRNALDVRLFSDALTDLDEIQRFARSAVQCFGGVDAVVNLVQVAEPTKCDTAREVEETVSNLLALPYLVTRIAANRMRTMMTEGTILNVIASPRRASARARTIAGIARSALASLTRGEAETWGPHGIRINAIAPSAALMPMGDCVSSIPDVASLALHLSSTRGSRLSGLVFDGWCG
jgi:NAD(P)-dependent dehydrogenase (short-subunit alcohol dehydrogenase family)